MDGRSDGAAQEKRPAVESHNAVLSAQVMLDAAGFSAGEIDGRAGANLSRAVAAYQQSRDLRVSSRLDEATLERLREEFKHQPPVVTYTITETTSLVRFNRRSRRTSSSSRSCRRSTTAIHSKHSPNGFTRAPRCSSRSTRARRSRAPASRSSSRTSPRMTTQPSTRPAGVRIVVTKRTSALTVEDAQGRVLFFAPVTTGSGHDPLPVGRWKVTGVQQSPVFHYNPDLFWDADPSHSKAKIAPGPNNPVGVVWIDISKPHYGIHGTPEPSTVGHVQSHGCVRMTNWDVRRVAEWAKPGMLVVFQ